MMHNLALPNYQEIGAARVGEWHDLFGDDGGLRNFRYIAGVGVVDRMTEKGWTPMVYEEDLQPFYAKEAREYIGRNDKSVVVVDMGRPDAVLWLDRPLGQLYDALPQSKNKRRQLAKAEASLNIEYEVPTRRDLAWRSSANYLAAKYDDFKGEIPFDLCYMPDSWYNHFQWVTLTTPDGKLLGAAYFKVHNREWFWCGTVMDYDDAEARKYATGNVLLLAAMDMAVSSGAHTFNFGLDLFDYKAESWGTIRIWNTGLEYATSPT